jgi:hypothetical protein
MGNQSTQGSRPVAIISVERKPELVNLKVLAKVRWDMHTDIIKVGSSEKVCRQWPSPCWLSEEKRYHLRYHSRRAAEMTYDQH